MLSLGLIGLVSAIVFSEFFLEHLNIFFMLLLLITHALLILLMLRRELLRCPILLLKEPCLNSLLLYLIKVAELLKCFLTLGLQVLQID